MVKKLLIPLLLLCFSSASATEFLPEGTKKITRDSLQLYYVDKDLDLDDYKVRKFQYDEYWYEFEYDDYWYGLTDTSNHVLTPPVYDRICSFLYGYPNLLAFQGRYVGLLDKKGNTVLPVKYSSIHFDTNDSFFVMRDSLGIQSSYDLKTGCVYSDVAPYYLRSKLLVDEGDECGSIYRKLLVDERGEPVNSMLFRQVFPFKKGRAWAENDTISGYIDLKGEFQPVLRNACVDECGTIYRVKDFEKRKFGLMDEDYSLLTPLEYDGISSFEKDKRTFIAVKGKKYGVISSDNRVLIPFKYDVLERGAGNFLIAKKNKHYGVISNKDRVALSFKYDTLYGEYRLNYGGGSSFTAANGSVSEFCYEGWKYCEGMFYIAQKGNKMIVMDTKWNTILTAPADKQQRLVSTDHIWLYDHNRKDKTEEYTVYSFGAKCGLYSVNKKEFVLPIKYKAIQNDSDIDFLKVTNGDDLKGIFSMDGKCVLPIKYDDVEYDADCDCFLTEKDKGDNEYWGVYDNKGKRILPAKYDDVEYDKGCDCFKAEKEKETVTFYSRKGERMHKK